MEYAKAFVLDINRKRTPLVPNVEDATIGIHAHVSNATVLDMQGIYSNPLKSDRHTLLCKEKTIPWLIAVHRLAQSEFDKCRLLATQQQTRHTRIAGDQVLDRVPVPRKVARWKEQPLAQSG